MNITVWPCRVVVLDKVTDLLLLFGKLLVVGGVGERIITNVIKQYLNQGTRWDECFFPGVLSFFFFSGRIRLPGDTFHSGTLNYYWMPIIVSLFLLDGCYADVLDELKLNLILIFQTVVFGSYLIAHGFFSVYNMCVDTLFLCFCE